MTYDVTLTLLVNLDRSFLILVSEHKIDCPSLLLLHIGGITSITTGFLMSGVMKPSVRGASTCTFPKGSRERCETHWSE